MSLGQQILKALPSTSKDEHNDLRCVFIFSDHQGTELYIFMNIIWYSAASTPTGRVFHQQMVTSWFTFCKPTYLGVVYIMVIFFQYACLDM